jgi:nitrogen fixation/metabolism regulation signal transduction histidine kinase
MTLRTKLIVYFVLVHLIPAVALLFVVQIERGYVIFFESLVAVSLVSGILFARALTRPMALIDSGTQWIREEDFASTLRPVGQRELDRLIEVFNSMLSRLREERLRAEEQSSLVARLLELTPSGVIMLDLDGRLQQANPGAVALLGIVAHDIGRRLEESNNELLRAVSEVTSGEARMLATSGRQRLRCWRGEFFDRGFVRAFFVIEELTDELRASEKAAYEKVIRMLSHEINNSVGAVASLLDTLQHFGKAIEEENRGDFSRAIGVASSRLRSLDSFTRGFASVVKIPPPQRSTVDLTALIRDVVTLLGPELGERQMSIEMPDVAPVLIAADKNQLEQVVLNIFRNAIEASVNGKVIHVRVEDGEEVVLRIRDEGEGIAPEIQSELFTPFFTSKPQGRGLGLTIIHDILSNHGAAFTLQSAAEGGAEFVIRFPR